MIVSPNLKLDIPEANDKAGWLNNYAPNMDKIDDAYGKLTTSTSSISAALENRVDLLETTTASIARDVIKVTTSFSAFEMHVVAQEAVQDSINDRFDNEISSLQRNAVQTGGDMTKLKQQMAVNTASLAMGLLQIDDAVAKVESFETTVVDIQTNFNEIENEFGQLQTDVNGYTQEIANANENADDALTAAQSALAKANAATTTANLADTKAENAQSTANIANNKLVMNSAQEIEVNTERWGTHSISLTVKRSQPVDGTEMTNGIVFGGNGMAQGLIGLPFSFGIDSNGNYGYYKVGADTVTPFKSALNIPWGGDVQNRGSLNSNISSSFHVTNAGESDILQSGDSVWILVNGATNGTVNYTFYTPNGVQTFMFVTSAAPDSLTAISTNGVWKYYVGDLSKFSFGVISITQGGNILMHGLLAYLNADDTVKKIFPF